ncbi:MAG: D-2-hydroxyacid dehydrogenase [Pseudomonadales bacterium]|nr:D-2-hydroxyacid dehydrogenase [Pseudomonadales bacterium]
MTKVIVLPGLTLNKVTDDDIERIRASGGPGTEVVVCNFAENPDHAKQEAADADVILGIVPPELFAAAPKLRWVQSISSGVDSFMYPEFINNPVVLTSEKGLVGEHLADHGFGLLLMLTRQLASARDLGPDAWNHRPALRAQEIELTGATMAIIGLGGTGRAMARRALAFGMNIVAIDRDTVAPMDGVTLHVRSDHLHEILSQADVVSICCPLTTKTDKLINASTIAQMKEGALLINVTRGEVIDEDDVVAALKSGHIRGAGLDVAPREPLPPDSELWTLENVVMTPHTAGASQFRAGRNLDRFVENLQKFVNNEPLDGVIDKTLGY